MRRTLYYILDLGTWLRPLKLPKPRLAAIGWTKLAIIAEHLKKHPAMPVRKALAYAETFTASNCLQSSRAVLSLYKGLERITPSCSG